MEVDLFQILRPVPASPMHKPPNQASTNPSNVSPPSQLPASLASHASHLFVDSSTALAKSRSLPRGLPSDGSAFNAFENVTTSTSTKGFRQPPTTSGPLSLNPDSHRKHPGPPPAVRPPGRSADVVVEWLIYPLLMSLLLALFTPHAGPGPLNKIQPKI